MTEDSNFSFETPAKKLKKRDTKTEEDRLNVKKMINFKKKEFADLESLFAKRPEFNNISSFLRYLIIKAYKAETEKEDQ